MRPSSSRRSFWNALEDVPGVAAVSVEWRDRMDAEFDKARGFLRPSGALASSYPCTATDGCGCYHDVVMHGDDDIVSVCHCERGCETVPLRRSDIVVFELNRSALDRAVAKAFGLTVKSDTGLVLPGTTRVGVLSPYAGFRFPAYLAICQEQEELLSVADGLIARVDSAFVLFAPSRAMCTAQMERRLAARKAIFLPLAGNVVIADGPAVRLLRPRDEVLAGFLGANLPRPQEKGAMLFFPTPPDATWRDVEIQFKDGQTVSIKAKGASGIYNYTELGMSDRRNGDPTKQWELLRDLADGLGTLDWSSRKACRQNQKRRERLAADLRAFFRIEGDPLALTPDGKGFRTLFRLAPRR